MADDIQTGLRDLLRGRLHVTRNERRTIFNRLALLDKSEERVISMYARAFPGEHIDPPAYEWDQLTDREQMTLRFMARRRGHLRRFGEVMPLFCLETGEDVKEYALRLRLSRLREKQCVERTSFGWTVVPRLVEQARNAKPVALGPSRTESLDRARTERLKGERANARRKPWELMKESDDDLDRMVDEFVGEADLRDPSMLRDPADALDP